MSRVRAILGRHAATIGLLTLVLIYASEISSVRSLFDEGFVSTRFLPKLLVGIALFALLAIAWRDEKAAKSAQKPPPTRLLETARPLALFVMIVAYIAVFRPLGFFPATIALSLGCLWVFDFAVDQPNLGARLLRSGLAACVIAALAYFLFAVAFGARLPMLPDFG